jgi:hypothetical protein
LKEMSMEMISSMISINVYNLSISTCIGEWDSEPANKSRRSDDFFLSCASAICAK